MEPLFAEAKEWHGMRRVRLGKLEKVNIEALLIASGQDVKRLLTFGGWGSKKLAQAAVLRPPSTAGHESNHGWKHRSGHSWRPTKAFSIGWALLVLLTPPAKRANFRLLPYFKTHPKIKASKPQQLDEFETLEDRSIYPLGALEHSWL